MPSRILHRNAVIECSSEARVVHASVGLRLPPRIESQEKNKLYVLVDDGPLEAWMYQFVATIDH